MTNISELPDEDKAALRDSLLQWKVEGSESPTIPLDVDLDGDGVTDAYGLDENDELIFVSGVKLEETVYVSEGDDVKADGGVE